MAQWPELPDGGQSVPLPLSLPGMLLEAVGYHGAARYVALRWWGGSGGDVVLSDGTTTAAGWWPAWRLLTREHVLGRVIFDAYDLGDHSEDPTQLAAHWLLCDRFEQTMWIGAARDVEALLATQPSELHAAARILGAERAAEAVRHQLVATPPPTRAQVAQHMTRQNALLGELCAWLDARLDEIQ